MNYCKQTSSMNGLIVADPAEVSNVRATAYADGGVAWPRPDREPDVYTTLRSNPDQPVYLQTQVLADYGTNGFKRADAGAHWEKGDNTAVYLYSDLTKGYQTRQSDRANTVTRRMLAVNTGNATYPLLLFIADYIDAKNSAFEKRWLCQAIDTINVDDPARRYYWRNDTRPGATSFLTDENANPNAEGYFYYYRGPKYVGSYNGRCTVDSLFPATMTSEVVVYPESATPGQGAHVADVLRQGTIKNPDGSLRYFDEGRKGTKSPQDGTSWPNGEEGYARLEIKASGIAAHDFLHVIHATDAAQAASAVTKIDVTGVMGARVLDKTALFRKSGGDIGQEGTGTYATGVTISGSATDLFAAVAPGTWQVHIGGVQQGSDYVVNSTNRCLWAAAVPTGALTLVRTL
jgi:hypothetical protein